MATEDELAVAAGVAVGGHSVVVRRVRPAPAANPWTRQGREAIQGSHSLTTPLARWAPEPLEPEVWPPVDAAPGESESDIAIPESVLRVRAPQRLPEDAVCRSPIAGLVITVLATVGQQVSRLQAVMVIEAMKMENNVCPEVDGVLKAVHVSPGDAVKAGQVLFELA